MIHDGLAIVGLAFMVYAAARVHPALAWFAAGAALLAVGIGGIKMRAPTKQEAKARE